VSTAHVVIVTGLSGSGKSTAIRALEDIGFFCIDNLPLVILDKFLLLAEDHEQVRRVALGIDARERLFLDTFPEALARVRAQGHRVEILFLDCQEEALLRRYSATRRRHPLEAEAGSLAAALELERRLLEPLKEQAAWIIDTSTLNVHQLKARVMQAWDPGRSRRTGVVVMSFGYRNGVPREADYVIDCRGLPNPYFVDDLRPLTGRDPEVRRFLEEKPEWPLFRDRILDLLRTSLPMHEAEERPVVTVAFGCTGGQHRSVAMAVVVAEALREGGHAVSLAHRELEGGA